MGVGFGTDEAAARKDAARLMGKMFPFNDGKVKVEFIKAYWASVGRVGPSAG